MSKPMDKDFTANLAVTLYQNSHDKKFTDFRIKAGTKTTYCHRSVICANSEYFRSLCKSGVKEAELDNAIVIEGDGEILTCVMEYMYLGATDITPRNVESLVLAADFVSFHQLIRKCEEIMLTNLSVDNLLSYHNIAKKIKLVELSAACERLAKDRFLDVVKSEWYLSLTVQEVEDYLQADDLSAPNEDLVLDAVIRWIDECGAPSNVKDSYIERLMPSVRLSKCTTSKLKELSKNPGLPNLLQLKILQYLQHGQHEGITSARRSNQTSAAAAAATTTTTPAPTASAKGAKPKSGSTGAASSLTSAASEEHMLLVGGATTGNVVHSSVIFLDKPQDVLTNPPLCADASFVSVCALPDGDGLIASGGLNIDTKNSLSGVQKFSLKDSSWTDLPDMLNPRHLHGLVCINKRLFADGGILMKKGEVKKHLASVSVLDLRRSAWTEYQPLDVAVAATGVAAVDSDLFVLGGHDGENDTTHAYRYNSLTGKRTSCQPMPKPCTPFKQTVAVDHYIFALDLSSTVFMQYDTKTDQWSVLPCPLKKVSHSAMVLYHGMLFVTGGCESDYDKPSNQVQSYDIENKTWWLEKQTTPLPLRSHVAVVLTFARKV